MFKINETATGYDLAELLHGESGIFEACSPNGEKFQVVSRAGHSISNLRPYSAETKQNPQARAYGSNRKRSYDLTHPAGRLRAPLFLQGFFSVTRP